MRVYIDRCTNPHHWYSRYIPFTAEVEPVEQDEDGDQRITNGPHAGKHVAIADCSEIVLEASA